MGAYDCITIVVLVVGAIIALSQFRIAALSLKADHKRRKMQATMEYMDGIRPNYSRINNELRKEFAKGPISESEVTKILADPKLRDKVRDLLGIFDHLAVGVHAEVFDIRLVNKMSGGYLMTIFERYSPYINKVREHQDNEFLYKEYEDLVSEVTSLREMQNATEEIEGS